MNEVAVIYTAILSILAVAAGYITLLYKNNKKTQLYAIVKTLVDEAEIKYGSGTGELKYNYVVKRIYSFMPGYVRMFVSEKLLDLWIETAVNELQDYLDKATR